MSTAGQSVTARDYHWVDQIETGKVPSTRALARLIGVGLDVVESAFARVRRDRRLTDAGMIPPAAYSPRFTPLFGCRPFTPQTTCEDVHPGGSIPTGSRCVCMVCHQTGHPGAAGPSRRAG
jgi:hypothetical protein